MARFFPSSIAIWNCSGSINDIIKYRNRLRQTGSTVSSANGKDKSIQRGCSLDGSLVPSLPTNFRNLRWFKCSKQATKHFIGHLIADVCYSTISIRVNSSSTGIVNRPIRVFSQPILYK